MPKERAMNLTKEQKDRFDKAYAGYDSLQQLLISELALKDKECEEKLVKQKEDMLKAIDETIIAIKREQFNPLPLAPKNKILGLESAKQIIERESKNGR